MFSAFIDESGQRAKTPRSSEHFVMSAVIIKTTDLPAVAAAQAQLRIDMGRRPGDTLHWKNFKTHAQRLHAAQSLARMPLTISSVVVCKRHLPAQMPDEDHAYLFTLRFLLERLSWYARDNGGPLTYTLAHVVRFKIALLRSYEQTLAGRPTQIAWTALDPHGGYVDQPNRVEQLQLADTAASATAAAFEPDPFGNTEPRYLQEMRPVLYRRGHGLLTSYGLKMHPWNATTKAAYPWVAAL